VYRTTAIIFILYFVELLAIQDSSDVIIRPAESKQLQSSVDVKGFCMISITINKLQA